MTQIDATRHFPNSNHAPSTLLSSAPSTAEMTENERALLHFPSMRKPEPIQLAPVSDEIAQLRDTPERRAFDSKLTFQAVMEESPGEVGRVAAAEFRELALDLNLNEGDLRGMSERATRLRDEPQDPEAQREATITELNRRFGNDAAQRVREARALIQRDPRTAKMIDHMGLGDDAPTLILFAEKARSQIAAGHLKRPAK